MTNSEEMFFTEPIPEQYAGDPVTQEGMVVTAEAVDPDQLPEDVCAEIFGDRA